MFISDSDATGLQNLILAEVGVCFLMLLVPMLWFPDRPSVEYAVGDGTSGVIRAPLLADESEKTLASIEDSGVQEGPVLSILESLRSCATNVSAVMLIVSGGMIGGAYTSWQGVMPIVFNALPGYTDHDGDIFAFSSGVMYCIGGYIGGEVSGLQV
jgi:hypothetical protein